MIWFILIGAFVSWLIGFIMGHSTAKGAEIGNVLSTGSPYLAGRREERDAACTWLYENGYTEGRYLKQIREGAHIPEEDHEVSL